MVGLAAVLLLALPAWPAMAEQCSASHIQVNQAFPLVGTPAVEGVSGGVIIRFSLAGCDNPGSFDTPREYQVPFCVEIFDTTPCDDGPNNCLANNVAGASGILGAGWNNAGEFKRCTAIAERESFASALITAHDNSFPDTGKNSIYAIIEVWPGPGRESPHHG